MQGSKPSLAMLGPVLAAKLGDFEGKLGYREVMLKLSWAMLCHVEAICQILFGHVVGFANRAKILSGFLRTMLAAFGGQVQLSCGYVGTVGTILGSTSAS